MYTTDTTTSTSNPYTDFLNHIYYGSKTSYSSPLKIEKVIFNDPATIVFWSDKTRTVVKAGEIDIFDPEKGLAMAISKKVLGNEGNYYNTFKKWLPADYKKEEFESMKNNVSDMLDKTFGSKNICIICGDTIPEGRMMCPHCEKTYGFKERSVKE